MFLHIIYTPTTYSVSVKMSKAGIKNFTVYFFTVYNIVRLSETFCSDLHITTIGS
jgi:hypothetical protein